MAKFTFGKYKGTEISDIIRRDTDYVTWCLSNISTFRLTKGEVALFNELSGRDTIEYKERDSFVTRKQYSKDTGISISETNKRLRDLGYLRLETFPYSKNKGKGFWVPNMDKLLGNVSKVRNSGTWTTGSFRFRKSFLDKLFLNN